jgi:hypothetical protein
MSDQAMDNQDVKVTEVSGKRKRGSLKTAIMTLALLVAEAGLIGGGFMMFAEPARTEASATDFEAPASVLEPELAEVLIFDDHLFNDASGIGFMYSTRIYLEIDQRDKAWLEIEAQGAPGKIEAALMSIWKSASRRDLESDELGAIEARVARALVGEGLFDRRPASVAFVDDGGQAGQREDASTAVELPDGPIIHDVIVVMELGRRINR